MTSERREFTAFAISQTVMFVGVGVPLMIFSEVLFQLTTCV